LENYLMATKLRKAQLLKMPRGMALQWIKKINPKQCDDPEWAAKVKSGEIKLVETEAGKKSRENLLRELREKNNNIINSVKRENNG